MIYSIQVQFDTMLTKLIFQEKTKMKFKNFRFSMNKIVDLLEYEDMDASINI